LITIDLHNLQTDWSDAASRVADVLAQGGIAVVPTDTVYGLAAAANNEASLQKLMRLKGRSENHPFALAFSCREAVADFCGELSPLASRFARRVFPGPVSIVLDIAPDDNDFCRLPLFVQRHVSARTKTADTVCCRIPDHPLTQTVLGELGTPVILTSANRSGAGESQSVDQILADLGGGVDIAVSDGILTNPKPSTILKITDNEYSILRQGSITETTIKRLAATVFLFVCTGNICRSPMAERICEAVLAEKLHCRSGELEEFGYAVLSAATLGQDGNPASANAVAVMQEYGIDLSGHKSQRLTQQAVLFADYIYVMTREHRNIILSQWHDADSRIQVLRTDGGDIADPYGGTLAEYRYCAEQIKREIDKRLTLAFHADVDI
jgi:protein-tyrosine phosphatase